MAPPVKPKIRLTAPALAGAAEQKAIIEASDRALITKIKDLVRFEGHGQEMGREADGPEVNRRRGAVSAMHARYGERVLEVLPRRNVLKQDLISIRGADLQPIQPGQPFDFSWSTNPMSTAEVLTELANRRAAAAQAAAAAIKADPSRPYDASDDGLGCHLLLGDPGQRSQVLADTLLQLRARRRSSALMDRGLLTANDPLAHRADGRIGSSGVVTAFEQRLACVCLPALDQPGAARERALLRFVVAQQIGGSVNALYEARNTVAILSDYLGDEVFAAKIADRPGLDVSLYHSIHQRYSANTPKAVDYFLKERAFTGGRAEDRPEILSGLVSAATESHPEAKKTLAGLEARFGYRIAGAESAKTSEVLTQAIVADLRARSKLEVLKGELEDKGVPKALALVLGIHRSLCQSRPSAQELMLDLPFAAEAEPAVAVLISALQGGQLYAQVEAVGLARSALSRAFDAAGSGFERQMLARLDRQVELIQAEVLGLAEIQLEKHSGPGDQRACLLALKSAIRGVLASGLDAIRGREKSRKTERLEVLLEKLDRAFARGKIDPEEARVLYTQIFKSASELGDAMRVYLRRRESAIHFGKVDVDLDPYAIDGLIKETPLHYLLGLAQRGLGFAAGPAIGNNEIRWTKGMRVLSEVGPRVYRRVLVAKDVAQLKRFKPGPEDLCIVQSAREKQLVFGGGLFLDAEDAGPGLSHASVLAMGHAISAVALPHLRGGLAKILEQMGKGGLYVDDRAGSFLIKPVQAAIDEGLITAQDVPKLRPGTNRALSYFDLDAAGNRILLQHDDLQIFPDRETRPIELLVPDLEDRLGLGGPIGFSDLAKLPVDRARQLAGEKGTVLARLSVDPRLAELGVKVPEGAVIPPFVIAGLLKAAKAGKGSLLERFNDAAKAADPRRAPAMKKQVIQSLTKLLLEGGRPTATGKKLLAQLERVPGLEGKAPWILRSSFTGEDRPNKSAAGQYTSVPDAVSAKQRLAGIIEVIASTFNTEAVRSNRELGVDASRIWPAVIVQRCLDAEKSGVAASRGRGGAFGEVTYQAKRGRGGAVNREAAEEGVIGERGNTIERPLPGAKPLVEGRISALLRDAVLGIEAEFNRNIEPGKGSAVDVEWAWSKGSLWVVQSRVIPST